jgi:hypothetical protein
VLWARPSMASSDSLMPRVRSLLRKPARVEGGEAGRRQTSATNREIYMSAADGEVSV